MTATLDASPRFRWDRLTSASALGYCLLAAGLSVGVVLKELRGQFGMNGVVTALHSSTFGVALLCMGLLGVRLVNRIGRRAAVGLTALAITSGVTLFCLGPIWPVTLAGTAIAGAGGALLVLVMPGVISDHHGPHRAAAFAATNGVAGIVGVLFSLAIGAALSAGWSWRPVYLGITAMVTLALVAVGHPVTIPAAENTGGYNLRPLRDARIRRPWSFVITAVLADFAVGVWSVTYLGEVGGASSGAAPVLAASFALTMFASRLLLPSIVLLFGARTIAVSFIGTGLGALVMVLGPNSLVQTVGLAIIGFAAGPLYPLTVDRFYAEVGDQLDSVTLGGYCSLASGVAVTLGPLALGVLSDLVGLRWALLAVPAVCLVGAVTQRHRSMDGH